MATQSAQWVATARVVRRMGFGATGPAVDAAVKEGAAAHVARVCRADPAKDAGVASTPAPQLTLTAQGFDKDDTDAKATLRSERSELVGWWLRRMAAVTEPWPERRAFYWHNHFATSLAKVRFPVLMLRQNDTLHRLGGGPFRDLAVAMLTDPAMVRWLDGNKNRKGAANENLSREYMELFTLGDGAYTEQDVREGARALTGWVLTPQGTTQFRPARHDQGSKTVLGVTGDLDAEGFADAVLARQASATHVVTRMWTSLVAPTPPSGATQTRLLTAYGTGRDLTALTTAMLTSEEMRTAEGSLVVSPVEWAVGAVRALRVDLSKDQVVRQLSASLRTLGQLPFYPPSVGGWPSGQAWLSTAALSERLRCGQRLAAAGDLSTVVEASRSDRLDATAYLLGVGGWSDRSVKALTPYADRPPALVAVALSTPEYLVH